MTIEDEIEELKAAIADIDEKVTALSRARGTLENQLSIKKKAKLFQDGPWEITYNGVTFRLGEYVCVESAKGIRNEKIERVSPEYNFIEHALNGWHTSGPVSDLIELNPNGSFIP